MDINQHPTGTDFPPHIPGVINDTLLFSFRLGIGLGQRRHGRRSITPPPAQPDGGGFSSGFSAGFRNAAATPATGVYRASASITTAPAGSTGVEVRLPPGLVDGDLIYGAYVVDQGDLGTPSGYDARGAQGGEDPRVRTFSKISDGSDGITIDGHPTRNTVFIMQAFRGVDQSNPFALSAPGAMTGNSSSPTMQTVTTTSANALIVAVIGADDEIIRSIEAPEGFTDLISRQTGVVNEAAFGAVALRRVETPGTVTGQSFSLDASASWITYSEILNAARG